MATTAKKKPHQFPAQKICIKSILSFICVFSICFDTEKKTRNKKRILFSEYYYIFMKNANEEDGKKSNQTNACYLCGFKKKMNNLLFNCMSYSICDNVKRRTHLIEKKTAAAAALCFICDRNAFAHWSPSIISIHGIERAECRRFYIHESMLFFFLSSRSSLLHLFRSFHFTAFASIEWNHCEAQGKHL